MAHTDTSRLVAEIRAEMARQGVTSATVSDRSDIPRSTLSRKLSERADLTVGEAVRIADALGVTLSELARRAESVAA